MRKEEVMYSMAWFPYCIVLLVNLILFVILGSVLVRQGKNYDITDKLPMITNTYDIPRDWQRQPFVEITVVDHKDYDTCPEGMEVVFEHTWLGVQGACDCRDTFILESRKTMRLHECYTKDERRCEDVPGRPAIKENIILGKRICGRP